jgi:protein O-mannosyl-transferase
MTFRGRSWFGVAGLVLLVLATYWPVRSNGFIWDDNYIEQNINLRTLGGLGRIWRNEQLGVQYYPLTLTSFWAEYHLWGARAEAFHLDNVLLEALSAILLWQLLTMLNVPGAWAAAAIWAVHPINVETVAWATERKNVLSGVFYLAAGIVYLRGRSGNSKFEDQATQPIRDQNFEIQNNKKRAPHDPAKYLLALCLFILAMLSKTTASTFPAAVLLVEWWKRGRISRAEMVRMLPFFCLAAAGGNVTSWVERTAIGERHSRFHSDNTFSSPAERSGFIWPNFVGPILWSLFIPAGRCRCRRGCGFIQPVRWE